ncbi:hypothetical protein ABPG74_013142 [Tetrahymena malaccensis]
MVTIIICSLLGVFASLFAFILYKIVIYPKIRLMGIKQKYGEKIKVYFHPVEGIFAEFKEGLVKNNDSAYFLRNLHQKNLKAIAFNFGAKVGFSFLDCDLIKEVHQNHEAFQKVDASMAITFLLGNSMLYANGKQWQRMRHFFGKSFHFQEVKSYLPNIKDICSNIFGDIKNHLKDGQQQEINVVQICEKVTSEIVFRSFFGSTCQNLYITNSQGKQIPIGEELVSAIMDSLQLFFIDKISLLKWIFFDKKGYEFLLTKNEKELKNRLITIRQSCLEVIFNRKSQLVKDIKQAKNNLLDQYLIEIIKNQNNYMTYDAIVDNFLGLFFAGTDTTGNMTGVALYYLSRNPEIQREARDEIINLLSKRSNSNNPEELFKSFSFEDISELNLLNGILKESLRLIPPAIDVFPRFANRNVKIGEFEIKKGDVVSTHFIYNQLNPDIFAEPEKFNPQRWMNTKEQFNFTPFSMGPRKCIGQHLAMIEGKSMLTYILLNFEILQNYQQEVVKEFKIIYGFKYDDLVFFKRRN